MESVDLKVQRREGTGKQITRKLRASGLIPATLYGPGVEPVTLQVEDHELEMLFRGRGGGSFILRLSVDDAEPVMTIIREKQVHPVSRKLIHIDFQRINMDKPITVHVPVHLTGEAPGVKDFGGILEHSLRSVDISCLPTEIPDEIVVDINELGISESIHVRDIQTEKFSFVTEADRTVVAVAAPRISTEAEEAEAEEAAEEGEGAEAPAEGEEADASKGDEAKDKD